MGIEALLLSQVITITGSTGQVVTRQADGSLALEDAAGGGGVGGSTGATDNAILRADGTGGATLQNSGVTISDSSEVLIVSGAVSAKPLRVRAAASQTGNLQEWQNSAGAVLSRVASSGAVFGVSFSAPRLSSTAYNDGFYLHDGVGFFIGRNLSYPGGTRYNPEINAFDDLEIGVGAGRALRIGRAFSAAPTAQNIQATSSNGTNISASKLTIASGSSSGSATPAVLAIATTTVGSSGTTVQNLRDVVNFDGNTTSDETPMLLLDCAKGTLQRVSIGAADSGGTGFKALRVPN